MTTKAKMDYVEMFSADNAKTKAFYSAAFGWTFMDYGPDYMAFDDTTREAGGFHATNKPFTPIPILYSDDLNATRAQVVAAGGEVTSECEFPGGKRFHFRDPSGNELAVWTKA